LLLPLHIEINLGNIILELEINNKFER
jgi:hypothetical protein